MRKSKGRHDLRQASSDKKCIIFEAKIDFIG